MRGIGVDNEIVLLFIARVSEVSHRLSRLCMVRRRRRFFFHFDEGKFRLIEERCTRFGNVGGSL